MRKLILGVLVTATFGCSYKSTWTENKAKRDYLNEKGYWYRKVASYHLRQDSMNLYLQYFDSAETCFQMADSIQIFQIDEKPKPNVTKD